jgi:hypothetical protein
VQRVGPDDRDPEREPSDDAELSGLVYQHPESGVKLAEIHSLWSFVGPFRMDQTLPRELLRIADPR